MRISLIWTVTYWLTSCGEPKFKNLIVNKRSDEGGIRTHALADQSLNLAP